MKKFFMFFIAILMLASCAKQTTVEKPADKWNGYAKYLKCGEKTRDLKDKDNNKIGTIKSGIDDDAHFYVTYDCSSSGMHLSKSNMFAGNKKDMPLSKPCDPKEDHFQNSRDHGDGECTYTYRVPLTDMPPADEPGFVYAAHCRVRDCNGDDRDAWGDGERKFHDKGCGSYDDDYNLPENQFTILYGTSYASDSLKLFYLDITNNTSTLILQEYVGNASGTYDGTAYDVESGMFFFVNYNTGELFVNPLTNADPSFSAGTLNGIAASGTFENGSFYYVDEELNTINMVTFTSAWLIASETVMDTIPNAVTVNDIAMSPDGDFLYILGEVNAGGTELISWEVATETFYTMSLTINSGAQIAFGSDGILYAIAPIVEGGSHSSVSTVDTSTGTLTVIEDEIIIIEDPFSDISRGPIM